MEASASARGLSIVASIGPLDCSFAFTIPTGWMQRRRPMFVTRGVQAEEEKGGKRAQGQQDQAQTVLCAAAGNKQCCIFLTG